MTTSTLVAGVASDTLKAGHVLTVTILAGAGALVQRIFGGDVIESPSITATTDYGPYLQDVAFRVSALAGATVSLSSAPQTGAGLNSAQTAAGQALVSRDRKTTTLTKCMAGRLKTVALGGDLTQHILIELEADALSVQIGVPNIHTATVAGIKVSVAAHDSFPLTLTSALITPTGSWVDATWAGAGSVTLPARIAAERQSVTYTDPINVQTIPRVDGGTRPLLMIRIEYPVAAGFMTTTQNGMGGSPSYFNGGSTFGRKAFLGTQAVLGVTTKAAYTSTATDLPNAGVPAIRYEAKVPGEQVYVAGDSTAEGVGAGLTMANATLLAALSLSTPQAPIEVYNGGKHGQQPATYFAALSDQIAAVRPTRLVYSPYSVNGVSVGGMTAAELSRIRFYLGQTMSLAKQYNALALLLEALPCNAAFLDSGPGDALRRAFNATELPGYESASLDVATGFAAAISGALDGDGQTTIAAGMSDDSVHPNAVGTAALYPFIASWLAAPR